MVKFLEVQKCKSSVENFLIVSGLEPLYYV